MHEFGAVRGEAIECLPERVEVVGWGSSVECRDELTLRRERRCGVNRVHGCQEVLIPVTEATETGADRREARVDAMCEDSLVGVPRRGYHEGFSV